MRRKFRPAWLALWLIPALWCAAAAAADAAEKPVKLEVVLLWGTDEAKSPNPKHKPVEADIKEKLKNLPLKWSNWFEVNRKSVQLAAATSERVVLSPKCEVEIKNTGKSTLEVDLFGKGEAVVKRTQALAKGEALFLGGNAPNSTAWLVAIKRIE